MSLKPLSPIALNVKCSSIIGKANILLSNPNPTSTYFLFFTKFDNPPPLFGDYLDTIGIFDDNIKFQNTVDYLKSNLNNLNSENEGGLPLSLPIHVWLCEHKNPHCYSEEELDSQVLRVTAFYNSLKLNSSNKPYLWLTNKWNPKNEHLLKKFATLGKFESKENLDKIISKLRENNPRIGYEDGINHSLEVFVLICEQEPKF